MGRASIIVGAAVVGALLLVPMLADETVAGVSLQLSTAAIASKNADRTTPPTHVGAPYPSASNTGVISGTKLQVHSGDLVVRDANSVIENMEIQGTLTITPSASGTVVRNVRVVWPTGRANPNGSAWAMLNSTAPNVTISDCEVDGKGVVQAGMSLSGPVTVTRCEVARVGDGIGADHNVTVTDSFIHAMSSGPSGTWHADSFQMVSGAGVVVRHNTIYNELNQTSAVGLWTDVGNVTDVLVEDNVLAGGGFTVYATQVGSFKMNNVRIVNNRFSTAIFPTVAYWGEGVIYPTGKPADLVVSGNTVYETGEPIG